MLGGRTMRRRGLRTLAIGLTAGAVALGVTPAVSSAAAVPAQAAGDHSSAAALLATPVHLGPVRIVAYRNCSDLQRVHRHGVGKKGAVDKVRGRVAASGVKTFLVNNALYAKNIRLDRDKDGVACEKK